MMNNQNNLLEQRRAMLTNPFALRVEPISRLTALDALQHLRLLEPLPELGEFEVRRSLRRFEETFGDFYGD